MKFNVAYVKKNPVMFGAIFLVFGLLIWLLINRGSSSDSGTTYVNQGPSEALQAAQLQTGAAIQAKQIDASVQTAMGAMQLEALSRQIQGQAAIATMEQSYRMAELSENAGLSKLQIQASLQALSAQLDNNLAITNSNNSFMIGYATTVQEAATQQTAINAAVQMHLSDNQTEAFKAQAKAMAVGALASQIGNVKANDRDNAFAALAGTISGGGLTYTDGSSGTFYMNGPGMFN